MPGNANTRKILVVYYAATAVFVVLDFVFGLNIRVAFLESLPTARIGYYGVCFACFALTVWRPRWSVLIGAFESLVTLSALILSLGMRALLAADLALSDGPGPVTLSEIVNFLISGSIAYVAWGRGIREFHDSLLNV